MKKTPIYVTAFMTAFFLAACMNDRDNAADNIQQNNPVQNVGYDEPGADRDTDRTGVTDGMDRADQNTQADLNVGEEAADRVDELEEVDGTTVLVTGETAYAAVNLKNGRELTDELQTKIEQKVKEADTSVQTVYISSDPDFTSSMENYAGRIENGEPVQGFFNEFGEAVRRVFPNA